MGVMLAVMLKQKNPVFATAVEVVTVVIMIAFCLPYFTEIFSGLEEMATLGGVDKYCIIVAKVIGIAYFCEIISALCNDANESAIAKKVELAGRLGILLFSLPIIKNLIETIIDTISMI